MILTFAHKLFQGRKAVYQWSIFVTLIISVVREFGIDVFGIHTWFINYLPLYTVGLGWIIPAFIAAIIGFVISLARKTNLQPEITE